MIDKQCVVCAGHLQGRFSELTCGRLPTLQLRGLFTRISYTGEQNLFIRCALYALIASTWPLLRLLPGNTIYSVFKRQ